MGTSVPAGLAGFLLCLLVCWGLRPFLLCSLSLGLGQALHRFSAP